MSNTSEPKYSHFRGFEIIEVIKITVNEGEGVKGDPVRRVTYWYEKDGNLISHDDHEIRQFVPQTREDQSNE